MGDLGPLILVVFLGRFADAASHVALLLFALEQYDSPALASVLLCCRLLPGLLVSPFAGAFLDRGEPVRLVGVDLAVACGVTLAIPLSSQHRLLPAVLLVMLVCVASLTSPFTNAGLRCLVVLRVPKPLWERANGLDSATYVTALIGGPAAAGALTAWMGARSALLMVAIPLAVGAGIALTRPAGPRPAPAKVSLLEDTRTGVRYLLRHRRLRNLAIVVCVLNIANGIHEVVIPIALVTRSGGGAATVGVFLGIAGVAGIVAGLILGRLDSNGREPLLLAVGMAVEAVGLAVLATGQSTIIVVTGLVAVGASGGIFDVAFLTLRQRLTDPAMSGRVTTVSSAVNLSGAPLGSLLAAPLMGSSAHHTSTALLAAAGISVAAACLVPLLLGRGKGEGPDAYALTPPGTNAGSRKGA
ncbi:MFS transporter [Embleya sp. NPDC127516]|uniref:MFS transporter n=1 Tax=Embleya sp. NPDC127516 TaxID=3363990 RepID=UPI0037FC3981